MSDTINRGDFIQHLTYLLKLVIYVNKGTEKGDVLENCVSLYNKFKAIENVGSASSTDKGNKDSTDGTDGKTGQMTEEDETFIRKCIKRYNLTLKTDPDNNPLDVKDKNIQKKILSYQPHQSLETGNPKKLKKWVTNNKVMLFTDIPLDFVLEPNAMQDIIWNYVRSVFFITQNLLSNVADGADMTDKKNIQKNKVHTKSSEILAEVLDTINKLETKHNASKLMSIDGYMNSKLINSGINDETIANAKADIKKLLREKGVEENSTVTKLIESITQQIQGVDMSNGNIIQNMVGIAKNVAKDLQRDAQKGGANDLKNTLKTISGVFQDYYTNTAKAGKELPTEVKSIFDNFVKKDGETDEKEMNAGLEKIISDNNLDREQFIKDITGDNGEIDADKMKNFVVNLPSKSKKPVKQLAAPSDEVDESLESIIKDNNLDRKEFYAAVKDANGNVDMDKLDTYMSKLQVREEKE